MPLDGGPSRAGEFNGRMMDPRPAPVPAGRWRLGLTILGLILALAALHLVLALPATQTELAPTAFKRVPVELALIVGLLVAMPRRLRGSATAVTTGLLALVLLLKLADIGVQAALSRPFNPVLDLYLLTAGWQLLGGVIGPLNATLAVAGAGLAYVVALILVFLAVRAIARQTARTLAGGALLAVAAGCILYWGAATVFAEGARPVHAWNSRWVAGHVGAARQAVSDRAVFQAGIGRDPFEDVPDTELLSALRGKDVLFVFVESYGRSALDNPGHGPVVERRLEEVEAALGASGFHARSGWLTSPIFGGGSWMAHATAQSGLWIDGQGRYDQLMATGRETLNRKFQRAGWRVVAAKPAIVLPWPEAQFFTYDKVYNAAALGYRGLPFNWITMPDQFTLAALHRLELGRADRPPVMAEVALISSHAPFIPVPDLLDWNAIGDGRVFNPIVEASETPQALWRNTDRVREAYRNSIAYSLAAIASYVTTFGQDDWVLVVLGDHQPGSLIAQADKRRDVPIHIIARDSAVLDRIENWGWTPGMRPGPDLQPWRMDQLRDRFLAAFTSGYQNKPQGSVARPRIARPG